MFAIYPRSGGEYQGGCGRSGGVSECGNYGIRAGYDFVVFPHLYNATPPNKVQRFDQ